MSVRAAGIIKDLYFFTKFARITDFVAVAFTETVLCGDSSHIFLQSLSVIQCSGRAWELLPS